MMIFSFSIFLSLCMCCVQAFFTIRLIDRCHLVTIVVAAAAVNADGYIVDRCE